MTPSLRAVLIVTLVALVALVATFMDFAWDDPFRILGLT